MFTLDQTALLKASLSSANVKSRRQGGRNVSYLEGWKAIEEANRIFGFDSWTRETVDLKCVAEHPREIGEAKKPGHGVSYIARVRIVVFAGDTLVTREGIGAGHGIDVDLGQAHESAVKESETDAMKRALMTFGYPFGLALYDKEQVNVEDPTKPKLLSEPAASKVMDKLEAEMTGCVTVTELDGFVRSDSYKERISTLPEKHRSHVRNHGKDRLAELKARETAKEPAA
jgi:DNA repair and recombination protein RAD52